MAEAADTAKTRRLPLWMSSSSTSTASATQVTRKKKRVVMEDGEDEVVAKRGGGSRKKRTNDVDDLSLQPASKKRTTANNKPKTRGRQRVETAASLPVEEEELTVDDLMSIAQEYVEADGGRDNQEGITTEVKSETQNVAASLTSRSASTFSIDTLPVVTSLCLSSDVNQDKLKDHEHSASEGIVHISSTVRDPAQDMLDLFLGPLLKKTSQAEKIKHEAFMRNVALDNSLQHQQSQNEEVEKQFPTLTKKKSSLRDKVAMLLD